MLDTALGGIGGCPYCGNGQATGMIPTEDLVQLLHVEGVATGIDLGKLIEAAKTLEDIVAAPARRPRRQERRASVGRCAVRRGYAGGLYAG